MSTTSAPVSRRSLLALVGVGAGAVLTACDKSEASSGSGSAGAADTLRLGYFPNVTHASPIVADQQGLFAKHLGSTALKISTFNAGPAAMEALKSGAVDATYVGPGPATNTYINSGGDAIRVVAGAATGGAALVVQPSITSAAALKGKQVASPQLGNTQDIALRYWLKTQGLTASLQGGGDVNVSPQANAQILDAFKQKLIAGAWVPEPYATQLVAAGGRVLVDEASLWPSGKFATTVLAVNPTFLKAHPSTVKAVLQGQLEAEAAIAADAAKAQTDVNTVIEKVTGKRMKPAVLADAWKKLTFTHDPAASSILGGAEHSYAVGILHKKPDLKGLVDVTLLNQVLAAAGKPAVSAS